MPELISPDPRVRVSYIAAMKEFAAEGRGAESDKSWLGNDIRRYRDLWPDAARFPELIQAMVAEADEATPRPQGWVPATTLWWVDGDEFLGRIAIRHRLTPQLRLIGGHIGYDVRPSARRRGHATAMLRAALLVARGLGIESALLTCNVDNVGSRKVIEACGGTLEDEVDGGLRFWAPT